MFYVAGKIIVVRVWGNQTAIKSMLHTSAQHSAQLNNQCLISTYCILIYAIFTANYKPMGESSEFSKY